MLSASLSGSGCTVCASGQIRVLARRVSVLALNRITKFEMSNVPVSRLAAARKGFFSVLGPRALGKQPTWRLAIGPRSLTEGHDKRIAGEAHHTGSLSGSA